MRQNLFTFYPCLVSIDHMWSCVVYQPSPYKDILSVRQKICKNPRDKLAEAVQTPSAAR